MMKLSTILSCLIISFFTVANSQQFDWQYSSRLPSDYPKYFLGINANTSLISNTGRISLSEGEVMDCCSFSEGTGWSNSIGFSAEYWIKGNTSIFANLNFSMSENTFLKKRQGEIRITDTLFYENELNANMNYILLEIGGKRMLFDSHFHIGAGIAFSYLLSNDNQIIERILKPEYFPWKERVVSEGEISNMKKIHFFLKIRFGYDFSLWLNTYSSTNITIGIPVQNITDNAEWRSWQFSFEFIIWRGIF